METVHRGASWRQIVLAAAIVPVGALPAQREVAWRSPPGTWSAAMVFDQARGEAVLFGGTRHDYSLAAIGDDMFAWNGSTWRNVQPAHRPSPRRGHCMAYDSARGRVVLFGGFDGTLAVGGETWEWDGTDWTQIPVAGPPARWNAAMAYHAALGVVLMFGGQTSGPWGDMWAYDGTSWQPYPLPAPWQNRPFPRSGHAMAYDLARQRVVLWGGESEGDGPDGVVWEFGPGGGTGKVVPASGPTPRTEAVLVDVPGIGVLMHGGTYYPGSTPYPADSWIWDGANWTALPGPHPPATIRAAGCFDTLRAEVVVTGGQQSSTLPPRESTWTYAAATGWVEPVAVPDRIEGAAIAFDSARQETVLLSGTDWTGGQTMTTWRSSGAGWTRATTPVAPAARYSAGFACDRSRQVCVLFGGRSTQFSMLSDTWEWNGSTWTQASPPVAPSPRQNPGLAFDRARGRVVLFGGWSAAGYFAETWEYDGVTWTQRTPTLSPAPRGADGSMAYDVRSGKVVLAGGWPASIDDTWTWDGSRWTPIPTATLPSAPARTILCEDDDIGRIVAVERPYDIAPTSFRVWEFTGTHWDLVATEPRSAPITAFDAARGRLVSVGYGDFDLVRPRTALTAQGNPVRLDCGGRPALGETLDLRTQLPVAFAMAMANAVVPGLRVPGGLLCRGTVLHLAPAQLQVFGFGTSAALPIPTAVALIDQPLCIQAAAAAGSCLVLSDTWVCRIQPD